MKKIQFVFGLFFFIIFSLAHGEIVRFANPDSDDEDLVASVGIRNQGPFSAVFTIEIPGTALPNSP